MPLRHFSRIKLAQTIVGWEITTEFEAKHDLTADRPTNVLEPRFCYPCRKLILRQSSSTNRRRRRD